MGKDERTQLEDVLVILPLDMVNQVDGLVLDGDFKDRSALINHAVRQYLNAPGDR